MTTTPIGFALTARLHERFDGRQHEHLERRARELLPVIVWVRSAC